MCDLSIIVPVFNAEKYVDKCIKSLLKQNLENVEIILINDGSIDRSDSILKYYATRNPKTIKYYERKNKGIAEVRNFGIEKASGKYIMYVDADDTIEPHLIDIINLYMQQEISIIKFKLDKVNEKGKVIEKIDGPVFEKTDGQDAFNKLAFTDKLIDSPCIYVFEKALFTKNNLKFMPNTEHEDFGLIPLLITKAKTVVSINLYGYHYLQTENSIVRNNDYTRTIKRFDDILKHYDNMILFIKSQNLSTKTQNNLKLYYTNVILLKLKELKDDDVNKYIKEIRKRKMITNIQTKNIKQFIKKMILNLNIKWYLKLK